MTASIIEKITNTDPESKSLDVEAQNIEQIKQLFPDVFREGKIDFEALKAALGDHIEDKEERFNFTWHGKNKARKIAQTPSTGTLRPCKEESVNWDTTENLFIEGDNLEVLKLLQKSYHQKVKMIYIDPPYNTGKDFVYKDSFNDNIKHYLEITSQVNTSGVTNSANSETSGRFHTDWLNMIYPRIKLARNLLKEDGAIFISIDENEYSRLKNACEEVFGETNYIGTFIWKRKAGGGDDSEHLAIEHEYVLCFGKNIEQTKFENIQHESPSMTAKYNKEENGRRFYLERLDKTSLTYSESMDYPIECPDGSKIYPPQPDPDNRTTIWRWSKDKVKNDKSEVEFHKDKKTGEWRVYTRTWESLNGVTARSLLVEQKHGRNRDGSQEIAALLGPKVFSNPKPVRFLTHLLNIGASGENDIVLDFFSGSGSIAHAAMQVSVESNSKKRFIAIQLPEKLDESKKPQLAAINFCKKLGVIPNIAEISKERIRRVVNKIADERSEYKDTLGFKVLKLDSTNINQWEPNFDNLSDILDSSVESIKPERSSEDVLYEILLKYGLDLTYPITEHILAGKTVYDVAFGSLIVCLDDGITRETIEAIGKLKQELDSESTRVVFKDAGFADDAVKVNAIQLLKQYGVDDVKSI